jgi:hypothetical protein
MICLASGYSSMFPPSDISVKAELKMEGNAKKIILDNFHP